MKWPFLWLLAAGCLAGCSGSGQTLDPFLGQATVPPPVTGQLAPANVSIPYYQGNPLQGSPPTMVPSNQTQPPVQSPVPQIGPISSHQPTQPAYQQKLGRLLAESPGDREYRVGRARLASTNQPVLIVSEEAASSEPTLDEIASEEHERGSVNKHDARTVSATAPITTSNGSSSVKPIAAAGRRHADSESPIRIPSDSSSPAPLRTASRQRGASSESKAEEGEVRVEPEPFAAPNNAVEITELPKLSDEPRRPRVNRATGGFRPALASSAPTRRSPVTIRRSSALSARETVSPRNATTRPVTQASTPANSKSASRAPKRPSRFGHATDYTWIKGKLEYLQSKRQWKLRYIPIDGETDEYGGSVVVQGDLDMSDYRPGEYVALQGKLDTENTEPGTFAPLYIATRVKRLSE